MRVCVKGPAFLYGGAHRRHNPVENQQIHVRRARPQQGFGAGIGGRAGREYVVDQYQAAPCGPRFVGHPEGALHVVRAFGLGQADLLGGSAASSA